MVVRWSSWIMQPQGFRLKNRRKWRWNHQPIGVYFAEFGWFLEGSMESCLLKCWNSLISPKYSSVMMSFHLLEDWVKKPYVHPLLNIRSELHLEVRSRKSWWVYRTLTCELLPFPFKGLLLWLPPNSSLETAPCTSTLARIFGLSRAYRPGAFRDMSGLPPKKNLSKGPSNRKVWPSQCSENIQIKVRTYIHPSGQTWPTQCSS